MSTMIEHTSTQIQEMSKVQIAELGSTREVQNVPEECTSVWSFYFKSKPDSDRFDS